MLIVRSQHRHGNLLPAAYNAISSVPKELCRHQEHGKRHPKSAYGTSLRLLSEQWIKFFGELKRLRTEYLWQTKDDHYSIVVNEYRELLHRIHEHLDACNSVIRSLCNPHDAKASVFDVQFLNQAKPPGWKNFQAVTKKYNDDHIGLLVNTLKHSQGELCGVYFTSETEFRPGYFLKDILPNGLLGPSARLHNGGNTAFSFARDMLIHLWYFYRIGEELANTVATIVRVKHSHELAMTPTSSTNSRWNDVLELCAEVRPEFFPDELKKPYPVIQYNHRDQEVSARVK